MMSDRKKTLQHETRYMARGSQFGTYSINITRSRAHAGACRAYSTARKLLQPLAHCLLGQAFVADYPPAEFLCDLPGILRIPRVAPDCAALKCGAAKPIVCGGMTTAPSSF